MKKIFKLLIIIALVAPMLTGCGGKNTEVKSHKIDNQEIKYQESNSNKENEVKSNNTSNKTVESDEYSEYTLDESKSYIDDDGNTILYRKYIITDRGMTFSVITCLNKSNKEIWKYTTKTTDDSQYPRYDFIGGASDYIYLKDDINIIMINTKGGKVVKEFKNVALESAATNYRGMYSADEYVYIPMYAGISSMYRLVVIDSNSKNIVKTIDEPEGYKEMHLIGPKISVYNDKDEKLEFEVTDVIKPNWDFSKVTKSN